MKHGWEIKKIGEVFDLQMGKTPSRDNSEYWGGSNVWVAISDLQDKYIGNSKEYITDRALEETNIRKVKANTVIMSFKLTVGRAAIATQDLYTNEAIMAFNLKEGFDLLPNYIYYYLKGYKWEGANKAVMGLTLNKATISQNYISLPPISEQEHIVAELDLLSGIIEKKRQQLKELDNLAQSIFYDMFGDPITNEKGWEVKKVKDIFNVKIGPFGSLLHNSDYISGGTPLVNPIHMQDEKICPDFNFSVSDEKLKELDSYLLQPNDIVFARRGDIGRCVIVGKDENGYLCGTGSLFIRPTQPTSPVFMLKSFRCKSMIEHLTSLAKGATMLNINCKIIEELNIIMPPLSLQQEFASKIEAIEKQTEILKQSIEEAETLFNSRMDYYFN